MNTALAQLILTADYDGTFDECIDFGEEPLAELPYEPYAQGSSDIRSSAPHH
jgi:hypothetical protein